MTGHKLLFVLFIFVLIIGVLSIICSTEEKNHEPFKFINKEKYILPQIQNKVEELELKISNFLGYRTYNPSIFIYKNKVYFTVRLSNYTMCTDIPNSGANKGLVPGWQARANSFIFIMDEQGNLIYLDMEERSPKYCVQGYEDARPFIYQDQLFIFSNALSRPKDSTSCYNQMWLSKMNIDSVIQNIKDKQKSIRPLNLPLSIDFDNTINQKNWMPFISKEKELLCVYSVNPHVILKCNSETGVCQSIASTFNTMIGTNIRGGSQVVYYEMPNGNKRYITITHKRESIYTSQIYTFSVDYPYQVMEYADNFIFGDSSHTPNIQFISGFAIVDGNAIITYGEDDCYSKFSKIPMLELCSLLKSVANGVVNKM
ncbi:MAG TPA: hypothetical protein PKD85_03040 [Saprospiraceae bacterium]|nr:hypothetical protein [Saprospiraceae bacterium]